MPNGIFLPSCMVGGKQAMALPGLGAGFCGGDLVGPLLYCDSIGVGKSNSLKRSSLRLKRQTSHFCLKLSLVFTNIFIFAFAKPVVWFLHPLAKSPPELEEPMEKSLVPSPLVCSSLLAQPPLRA